MELAVDGPSSAPLHYLHFHQNTYHLLDNNWQKACQRQFSEKLMLGHSVGVNGIDLRKGFLFQWMTRGVKDTESTYSYCQSSILSWLSQVCLELCRCVLCRCMQGSVVFHFLKHIIAGDHCSHSAWSSRDVPCVQLMWLCILMLIVHCALWCSLSSLNLMDAPDTVCKCVFPFGHLLHAAK